MNASFPHCGGSVNLAGFKALDAAACSRCSVFRPHAPLNVDYDYTP